MFAIIGELTDHGYKVRQERLLKEAALANEATEATSSKTKQFPKSLEMLKTAPSQQKLGKAISKLFPRGDTIAQSQQKASKVKKTEAKHSLSKGAEPTPKKVCSDYCVDFVVIPKDTTAIPRGSYKQKLSDHGLADHMQFQKGDSAATIVSKIIQLFPTVFSAPNKQSFTFMDASMKRLQKRFLPPQGFSSWNGAAIAKFVGQGRLYILPSHDVSHMLNTIVIILQS